MDIQQSCFSGVMLAVGRLVGIEKTIGDKVSSNHSAAICDRMSPTLKSTRGWVTLGPNLGVFPLEQTRHVRVAKSERPMLTNGEIIFEEFQPM